MKKLLFIFLTAKATFVSAVSTGDYKELSWVNVEAGHVYIRTTPEINVNECSANGGSRSIIKIENTGQDLDGFNELYSMVLAAYMSKTKMKFFVSGCSSSPWGYTVPRIYSGQLN